jgi:cleavage and polyadenylation specificity factor subunit 3
MATKRKASAMASIADDDPVDPSDEFSFIGLGGCQEVGRSCHIIQYKGKTIMVRGHVANLAQLSRLTTQ